MVDPNKFDKKPLTPDAAKRLTLTLKAMMSKDDDLALTRSQQKWVITQALSDSSIMDEMGNTPEEIHACKAKQLAELDELFLDDSLDSSGVVR